MRIDLLILLDGTRFCVSPAHPGKRVPVRATDAPEVGVWRAIERFQRLYPEPAPTTERK